MLKKIYNRECNIKRKNPRALIESRKYQKSYYPFRAAAYYGHLDVLRQIYTWCTPEQRMTMITIDNCDPFIGAASNGHLEIIQQIYSWIGDEEAKYMVRFNYHPYRQAVLKNHEDVALQLYKWGDAQDRQCMKAIKYFDFMDYVDLTANRK